MSNKYIVFNNVTPEDLFTKGYELQSISFTPYQIGGGLQIPIQEITLDTLLSPKYNSHAIVLNNVTAERWSLIKGFGKTKGKYILTQFGEPSRGIAASVLKECVFGLENISFMNFENLVIEVPSLVDPGYTIKLPLKGMFKEVSKLDTEIIKLNSILTLILDGKKVNGIVNTINDNSINVVVGGNNAPYVCYDLEIKFDEFEIIKSVINMD